VRSYRSNDGTVLGPAQKHKLGYGAGPCPRAQVLGSAQKHSGEGSPRALPIGGIKIYCNMFVNGQVLYPRQVWLARSTVQYCVSFSCVSLISAHCLLACTAHQQRLPLTLLLRFWIPVQLTLSVLLLSFLGYSVVTVPSDIASMPRSPPRSLSRRRRSPQHRHDSSRRSRTPPRARQRDEDGYAPPVHQSGSLVLRGVVRPKNAVRPLNVDGMEGSMSAGTPFHQHLWTATPPSCMPSTV
jgi:hypothetical protein